MSTATRKEKTHTFFQPIDRVSVTHIKQMYELYQSYYENTSLDIFINDLSKKSGVIMVTRKADDCLVGFSTQTFLDMPVDGKRVRGIFSGDTIIDKRYWGNNNLGGVFYKVVVKEYFKRPWVPFYWFLISKGYKTYLLLTNNFYNIYPRVGGNKGDRDERYRRVTESYCEQLFPEAFHKDKMMLNFGEDYVRLKEDVAEITPELVNSNPNIAFFEMANPGWRQGNELPCLAALDFESFLISIWHRPWKFIKKHILRNNETEGLALARKLDAEREKRKQASGGGWLAGHDVDAFDAGKAS
jgi:hypothetical protein